MKRILKWFDPRFLHLRFEILLSPHVRCEPAPSMSTHVYPALLRASFNFGPLLFLFYAGVLIAQSLFEAGLWFRSFAVLLSAALAAGVLYLSYVFLPRGRTSLRVWKSGTDVERLELLEKRTSELDRLHD